MTKGRFLRLIIGFIITILGNIIVSSLVTIALFVDTAINQSELLEQDLPGPIGPIRLVMLIPMSLGYLLLGYVTPLAEVLPSWAAILMILFVVLPFIPFTGDYLAAVWGIIYIGLGRAVWSILNVSQNKI